MTRDCVDGPGGPGRHLTRRTKKQHYVPRLHLRQFVGQDALRGRRGKLAVYDKQDDRTFWLGPDDAGHENHFLSVAALDGDQGAGAFFESFFQQYEDAAAPAIVDVLDRIRHGVTSVIATDAKRALAPFLAVQRLRTKRARAGVMSGHEAMDRVLRELQREHPEFTVPGWDPEAAPRTPVAAHADSLRNVQLVNGLTETLEHHVWVVLANATDLPFWTSDHPVALHAHVPSDVRGMGPRSYGAEVMFPLSPRYLLSMVERRYAETQVPAVAVRENMLLMSMGPEHVEFQRSVQVLESLRYVYAPDAAFALAREMCTRDPHLRDPTHDRMVVFYRGRRL